MGAGGVTEREQLLRDGALAILPTDTVYGIGCAAGSPAACARLYEVKERPAEQPTAVVFGSVAALTAALGPGIAAAAAELLPGPVTLIVPNPGGGSPTCAGPRPTGSACASPSLLADVAVLADAVGGLAMTSANRRGEPAPGRLPMSPGSFERRRPSSWTGVRSPGIASTIIDLTGPEPVVIRPGQARIV